MGKQSVHPNLSAGGLGLRSLRALPTQWAPRSFAFFCEGPALSGNDGGWPILSK